jgi:hypothetical protein
MKSRAVCAIMALAIIILTYVDIHQARTIQTQRALILDMYRFIVVNCR